MEHDPEQVVLLSDAGDQIGTALKSEVHTADTALHLAFSCYLAREDGRVLVTRRALTKKTWPGVWTNAFCGHPAPGEDMIAAVHRRADDELGASVHSIRPLLPNFRYRAIDASGVVENEICPVFVAELVGELRICPDEVAEYAWVLPADLMAAAQLTPFAFSPWLVQQLTEIAAQPGLRRLLQPQRESNRNAELLVAGGIG